MHFTLLEKNSSPNKGFYQKALVKLFGISNSKNPPWHVAKFRSKFSFFCRFLKNSILNIFTFGCELMVNHKSIWFYTHLHICSTCLRLHVSSLTKIHYLQIKPSERGTHNNRTMMLNLYGFVRWTRCIWWAIEDNYMFV